MSTTVVPDWPVEYRIKRALDVAGVDPDEMAVDLGVHPNTLWNWMGGRTKPRRMALKVISLRTGVPLWWLEGNDGGGDGGGDDTGANTQQYPRQNRTSDLRLCAA